MPNPAKQNTGYKLQEVPLTVRDHLDPDKHWIGEGLGVPTQTEIAATVGALSSPGDSPFVARADHIHKLGTGVVQTANIANDAVTANKIADGTIDQAEFVDTGWVTVTPDTGWSGVANIRKVAGFVCLTFSPSRDAAGGPLTMTPFFIPPGYRPSIIIRGVAFVTSPAAAVRVQLDTSGVLTAFNVTINAGAFIMGSLSWPI